LKRCPKAFWRSVRGLVLIFAALFATAQAAASSGNHALAVTPSPEGPVIEFTDGDFVLTEGVSASAPAEWVREPAPRIYRSAETKNWVPGDFHTLWGRFTFERSALGSTPIALYTVSMRNQFDVIVNGVNVFRNYAKVTDQKLAWYRPFLIPIPAEALKPGRNEIIIRAVSQDSVGVGRLVLGPHSFIQDYYSTNFFWRIAAPAAASFAMLVLGVFSLLLWWFRRQEIELLYLAISTVFWYFRNYQYFAEATPFDLATFNALAVASTYFATVATCAFFGTYLKLPNIEKFILIFAVLGVPLHLIHWYFGLSNNILYVPSSLAALIMLAFGIRMFQRTRSGEHAFLIVVMVIIPFSAFYDFYLSAAGMGWKGQSNYISLFTGLIYASAFLMSFGRRSITAFSRLETVNAELEDGIKKARDELAASEAQRQSLLVGRAVATERERLMQEMHDGIGSNLITALAVAEKQAQPASTIKTLRRAISDLKITVDSLEPVEGNLLTLLGNLRHRMAADLRDAGLVCHWNVEPCEALPWLDATNALHALRIFQEVIGNVLTHSGATDMWIGCKEELRSGVLGIASHVADNGCGFDASARDTPGKGLSNIRARADALRGELTIAPRNGGGSSVTLWLPYQRPGRL
jgi:signal transduction histidine kinase